MCFIKWDFFSNTRDIQILLESVLPWYNHTVWLGVEPELKRINWAAAIVYYFYFIKRLFKKLKAKPPETNPDELINLCCASPPLSYLLIFPWQPWPHDTGKKEYLLLASICNWQGSKPGQSFIVGWLDDGFFMGFFMDWPLDSWWINSWIVGGLVVFLICFAACFPVCGNIMNMWKLKIKNKIKIWQQMKHAKLFSDLLQATRSHLPTCIDKMTLCGWQDVKVHLLAYLPFEQNVFWEDKPLFIVCLCSL